LAVIVAAGALPCAGCCLCYFLLRPNVSALINLQILCTTRQDIFAAAVWSLTNGDLNAKENRCCLYTSPQGLPLQAGLQH
jgi:hypothetical protein